MAYNDSLLRHLSVIVTLLVLSTVQVGYAQRTCRYPDGTFAAGTVPCSSDEYTACCGTTDLCLSNGLCLNTGHQPYVISRGACTDPNWQSENCPQFCQNVTRNEGTSIINLAFTNDIATYCCGTPISNGNEVVCPYGNSFLLTDGYIVPGYAALANVSSLDAPTTANSSSSSSTTTATASTSTSSTNNAACSNPSSSSHNAAIGAGVGVPLGIIALSALLWALWERRRRQQERQTMPIPMDQQNYAIPPVAVAVPQDKTGYHSRELAGTRRHELE